MALTNVHQGAKITRRAGTGRALSLDALTKALPTNLFPRSHSVLSFLNLSQYQSLDIYDYIKSNGPK